MRLVVVSDMAHHLDRDGHVAGWGPTVRELDHLATLCDEIVHVAPLHPGPPSPTDCRYTSGRVVLRPVRAAGGAGILAKLGILRRVPSWVRAIRSELRHADAVHVRSPANISLIALVVLALARHPRPRWVKYAGNWKPPTDDAASYRLQRWILRTNLVRAAVTVNGSWPAQPAHVHTFMNPALTDDELAAAARVAHDKTLDGELHIAFAGRLDEAKGARRALDIAHRLAGSGVSFHLDVAGDGTARPGCEALVVTRGLANNVTFHGWLDRRALDQIYAAAHIVLLPSTAAEGFPKVLAEGMAHGAVPIAGDVSAIRQVLTAAGTGSALPPTDVDAFVAAVTRHVDAGRWRDESIAATRAASRFTYGEYLDDVRSLFWSSWGIRLGRTVAGTPAATSPLRIGVFGPHLGGNEGWVVSQGEILVRLLADAGHEVHDASTKPGRVPRAIDTASTLLRVGGALDVAVIEVFSGPSLFMAEISAALAGSFGVPVILVLHGGDLPAFTARHPWRVRRLLGSARMVVAPSPFLARALAGVRRDITVIPNALPLPRYRARTRGALRPRLLWMRTFEPIYRPELALEVLRLVRASEPSATLTMAGQDRGSSERMKAKAVELGIGHAVNFPGFLDPVQKQRAFDEHDVFLSTSAVDNAPVSVLEAAACGLVVVATDAGGLGDLLAQWKHGLLVPDGDASAMADAVRCVLSDASFARALSEGARALGVASRHDNVSARWDEIMQSLALSRRSRIAASRPG